MFREKAGILLSNGWLLWPQISLQVGRWRRRPDCLAGGPGGNWAVIEFDGAFHGDGSYQQLRDEKLGLRCWRYSPREIFGANFDSLVMQHMDEWFPS